MKYQSVIDQNIRHFKSISYGIILILLTVIYTRNFSGIFTIGLISLMYIASLYEFKRLQVKPFENDNILYKIKGRLTHNNYHGLTTTIAIMPLLFLVILFIDFSESTLHWLSLSLMLIGVVHIIYHSFKSITFSLYLFSEGFIFMGQRYHFKRIKKIQLIQTKNNTKIIEINDGDQYVSLRLNSTDYNNFYKLYDSSRSVS